MSDPAKNEKEALELPEPSQNSLPLTPEEYEKHPDVLPILKAPDADSYKNPFDIPDFSRRKGALKEDPPQFPPSRKEKERLKIKPSVLRKAATSLDEIREIFYKSAASMENPARTAASEFQDWDAEDAIRFTYKGWESQAGNVTAWMTHISDSLRASANTYHKTDDAVRDDIAHTKRPKSILDSL